MVYIGIELHARQSRVSVLHKRNSTIFEQTLVTSCENSRSATSASSRRRARLSRSLPPPA
jgi:hypothetical protein